VQLKAGEIFEDFHRIKCTFLAISLNTVGMEDKKPVNARLNAQEFDLIEKLRRQPKIMERVQKILEISQSSAGPLKTADEVEELLIQEMRRLGNATMNEWAAQAHERINEEFKEQDPTVLKRKKKR
jgi:hypothetical protein